MVENMQVANNNKGESIDLTLPTQKIFRAFCNAFGFQRDEVQYNEIYREGDCNQLRLIGEGHSKKFWRNGGVTRYTLIAEITESEPNKVFLKLDTRKGDRATISRTMEFDLAELTSDPEGIFLDFMDKIKR